MRKVLKVLAFTFGFGICSVIVPAALGSLFGYLLHTPSKDLLGIIVCAPGSLIASVFGYQTSGRHMWWVIEFNFAFYAIAGLIFGLLPSYKYLKALLKVALVFVVVEMGLFSVFHTSITIEAQKRIFLHRAAAYPKDFNSYQFLSGYYYGRKDYKQAADNYLKEAEIYADQSDPFYANQYQSKFNSYVECLIKANPTQPIDEFLKKLSFRPNSHRQIQTYDLDSDGKSEAFIIMGFYVIGLSENQGELSSLRIVSCSYPAPVLPKIKTYPIKGTNNKVLLFQFMDKKLEGVALVGMDAGKLKILHQSPYATHMVLNEKTDGNDTLVEEHQSGKNLTTTTFAWDGTAFKEVDRQNSTLTNEEMALRLRGSR